MPIIRKIKTAASQRYNFSLDVYAYMVCDESTRNVVQFAVGSLKKRRSLLHKFCMSLSSRGVSKCARGHWPSAWLPLVPHFFRHIFPQKRSPEAGQGRDVDLSHFDLSPANQMRVRQRTFTFFPIDYFSILALGPAHSYICPRVLFFTYLFLGWVARVVMARALLPLNCYVNTCTRAY